MGPASSCRVQLIAKETATGRWCVPEDVGCRSQRDDLPCHSYTSQGQCCKWSPERMDVQEETLGATRIQQWNKGPMRKMTAMSRKQEGIQQDHQADRRAGDCKANSWDFH
jgi:hypothetical protein